MVILKNQLKLASRPAVIMQPRRWFFLLLCVGLVLSSTACRDVGTLPASLPPPSPVLPTQTSSPTETATQPAQTNTPLITDIVEPSSTVTPSPTATEIPPVRFAVIGDYGLAGDAEKGVANMVLGWAPDFILTTGDNNYPDGAADTLDENVGQYFHTYIFPYLGEYGGGADINRFFPTLGNHDWNTEKGQAYLDYFTLPGNERYYEFTWGLLHFFALDSDTREPDGVGKSSVQGAWLNQALASSNATWNIVFGHYPPYSSGYHGSTDWMQWPYKEWGADVVLSGHDHTYERLDVNGELYFIVGLGGASRYVFLSKHPGSLVRYNQTHGAMLVEATEKKITFSFYAVPGDLIDSYSLMAGQ